MAGCTALDSASFSIQPQEFVWRAGALGQRQSTLLRILAGFCSQPTSGTFTFSSGQAAHRYGLSTVDLMPGGRRSKI